MMKRGYLLESALARPIGDPVHDARRRRGGPSSLAHTFVAPSGPHTTSPPCARPRRPRFAEPRRVAPRPSPRPGPSPLAARAHAADSVRYFRSGAPPTPERHVVPPLVPARRRPRGLQARVRGPRPRVFHPRRPGRRRDEPPRAPRPSRLDDALAAPSAPGRRVFCFAALAPRPRGNPGSRARREHARAHGREALRRRRAGPRGARAGDGGAASPRARVARGGLSPAPRSRLRPPPRRARVPRRGRPQRPRRAHRVPRARGRRRRRLRGVFGRVRGRRRVGRSSARVRRRRAGRDSRPRRGGARREPVGRARGRALGGRGAARDVAPDPRVRREPGRARGEPPTRRAPRALLPPRARARDARARRRGGEEGT